MQLRHAIIQFIPRTISPAREMFFLMLDIKHTTMLKTLSFQISAENLLELLM